MNKFLKELVKANVLGVLIFLVHGLILYIFAEPWYGDTILKFFLENQLFSVFLYLVNQRVISYFLKKNGNNFWQLKTVFIAVVCGVLVTIITVGILRFFLLTSYYGLTAQKFIESEKVSYYYLPLIISAIAITIFYGVYYWKSKQEKKVKQSKIIAGAASAKFDALKNQLDPHFLFNSLNVLASLIEENPKQAQKFTTSLSKVYRYVLEQKNKELVPVEEELAFARTYMNLLEMRFEDSIVVDIPKRSSHSEYKVVPLSLQLLLENAVKHNQVTSSKKLHIKIYEDGNRLFVKNNIQEKQVIKKSSGVGLQNIKQRYGLLVDSEVRIENDGQYFQVGIPLLTEVKETAFSPAQDELLFDKRYERAKAKVEALKGFYIHFAIYCIFVPVFIFLNVKSTSFPWALFPIFGWGWGIVGHAAETFGWNPLFNKKWESKKIDELMNDDKF